MEQKRENTDEDGDEEEVGQQDGTNIVQTLLSQQQQ